MIEATLLRLPVGDIRFVKELYPRLKQDDAAIERYRAALDRLPPIVVARGGVLVDGFHRWRAHQAEGAETIAAENLGDISDVEILRQSYRRNASHGQQLSTADKRSAAERLYLSLDGSADDRYAEIADLLSIKLDTAKTYASKARSFERQEQQRKAWDLHLDCWTQPAIATELDVPQPTIHGWLSKKGSDPVFNKPPESRQHFDVWQFGSDGGDSGHFGKMPAQIVENLLWLYTQPGDTIVDPFAGGGTTIDAAKTMGRRVWASDLHPANPLLPIHPHDITTGWPEQAPRKAELILLDPPYWIQAAGRYSNDPADLGNMALPEFLAAWDAIVKACAAHLADGGRLAYIVSPAQDGPLATGRVVDLATLMLDAPRHAGLTVERRIIVPYSTQQATGQQVDAAREHRKLLKLYRDLVVMRG